jgi:cytochrome c2
MTSIYCFISILFFSIALAGLAVQDVKALNVQAQNAELCGDCHTPHYTEINCQSCHNGRSDTARLDIAHYKIIKGRYAYFLLGGEKTEHGAKIIEALYCRRCHTIDKKGGNLASNLDNTIARLTPEEIDTAITEPSEQMPYFHLSDEDRVSLINALLSFQNRGEAAELIEVVQLEGNSGELFNEKCGACHKMITTYGSLGRKTLAPFLSGLCSPYYPPVVIDSIETAWNKKITEQWLKNPRSVKKNSVMPVTSLTPDETVKILTILNCP